MSMQRDGWWMDRVERNPKENPKNLPRDMRGPLMLLALIALADAMVWQTLPGLSLAVLSLTIIGAACLMAHSLPPKRAILAGVTVILAVAPVIELVQPLSILLLSIGLSASLCLIAGVSASQLLRSMHRYPWIAVLAATQDANAKARRAFREGTLAPSDARTLFITWAVPLGLGLIFFLLLVGANPVLDRFMYNLTTASELDLSRMFFWAIAGVVISAALIAHRLRGQLTARAPERQMVHRPGLINAASVTRSLILFNALFAVQTATDIAFLYGDSALPSGMTYAQYAHRGAYPLLAAALLAGMFAVLARPFTDNSPLMRFALILWLVQTLALVVASATRLEIYVDVYGLTRLRIAAGIWMAVVAAGLGLVIWQVQKGHATPWMLQRCAILGLAALYAASFLNVDRMIAEYNLTHRVQLDRDYLCSLGEAALDPIARHAFQPQTFCNWFDHWNGPELSTPQDWREWGFRNARLRTSLATLNPETTP